MGIPKLASFDRKLNGVPGLDVESSCENKRINCVACPCLAVNLGAKLRKDQTFSRYKDFRPYARIGASLILSCRPK